MEISPKQNTPSAKDDNNSKIYPAPAEQNVRARYIDRNSLFIYLSHLLSSFGDRVWQFAVGLYLYYLYPCSLTLTAIYGLATCGSLFLLGAPVGRWVDKSKRLEAARITIVIQNVAVVISATIMASTIYYKDVISSVWSGNFEVLIYVAIISIEIVAELASMANKLLLEKDWIVVLAAGDKQKLSCLNATMRTINLSCKILAPFAVGHLLDRFSYIAGAIFIASWNVVSAFVEFYLLHIIFSVVPELSVKKKFSVGAPSGESASSEQVVQVPQLSSNGNKKSAEKVPPATMLSKNTLQPQSTHFGSSNENADVCNNNKNKGYQTLGSEFQEVPLNSSDSTTSKGENQQGMPAKTSSRFHEFWAGWKVYFSHPIKYAGLGLGSLYMTVLCFDNVSIGYLSSQGVSAGLSGNFTALAALVGILGSLSFPFVRRKLGKNKAGIFGFSMETFCLLLCVMSVVAPGSPFVPSSISKIFTGTRPNCGNKNVLETPLSLREHWDKHSNVFLLVTGIILARYGLWIADLSVTQIFQEKVHESERGAMGGVQGSINQLMSLVKFGLTILLPYPETFGYLICISWLFVFLGWACFITFVIKDRQRIYASSK